MKKHRKKNEFIWLYMADDGTEKFRFRKEEALKRIEAYKKLKNEVNIVDNKEVSDNDDF